MEEPVVSFIANQLGNLLVEEAKFLLGVNDQVIELKIELNRLMAFLERINGINDGDPMLTNWEDEVRELAYDSQDIIEMFVLEVSSRRNRSFRGILKRFAGILNEGHLVHEVGSQISTIKGRISSFNRSLEVHGLKKIEGHVGESSSSNGWRKTRHHVEVDPVGLEADVKIVVQKLVEDEDCRIISIFGLGGLGKTTLARSVFHHKAVESHFNGNIAWACISQQHNPRDILQGILVKLLAPHKEEEVEKMSEDELLEHLCLVQNEKKCLVVLDDIWSLDAWSNFRDAFPIHGKTSTGSKILITTRDQALGRQIHPSCFRHQPSYLNGEESWELLKRKALGRTNDLKISPEMEAEGRKMAEECKGLPLAIIVLGGLLANKDTLLKWQEVYKKIKSQRRGKDHEQEDQVSKVLALSYHDLPYKYKPSFLYLSNFPEDYMIHAKTLYRLWIAEDIVSTDDKLEDEIMMDVAERYLDELVRRCIVQVVKVKFSEKIKYCCFHDVMRDFCLGKVKRHNFLTVVHPQDVTTVQVDCSSRSSTKIRRLAMHSSRSVDKIELPQSETFHYLRSILLFNPHSYSSLTELDWNFKNFKLLKTLQLENFYFRHQKSVESIGKLVRLRHLSFRCCGFMERTTSLCKLKNLQTLDLRGSYGLIGFENMGQLRHLSIDDWREYKIKLLGLTNLETLEGFNIKNFDVNDLFKLKNLRLLVNAKINLREGDQALVKLAAFVEYLNSSESHRLQKTSVKFFVSDRVEEWLGLLGQLFGCARISNLVLFSHRLSRLPEFNCSTSGLTHLALKETAFEEDPMPTLERLPKLQRLTIIGYYSTGSTIIMTCSAGGFPQLKTLKIAYLYGLKDWRVNEGAMPNLSTLDILSCQDLEMFPDGLRSITTLEKISISTMPKTFTSGLRAEDFHSVPVIEISFNLRVRRYDFDHF